MPVEARSVTRRPTNKAGIIKADGRELLVLLRDTSRSGARVRLVTPGNVPERLTLIAPMEKIHAACSVVWRRGKDLGLRFES